MGQFMAFFIILNTNFRKIHKINKARRGFKFSHPEEGYFQDNKLDLLDSWIPGKAHGRRKFIFKTGLWRIVYWRKANLHMEAGFSVRWSSSKKSSECNFISGESKSKHIRQTILPLQPMKSYLMLILLNVTGRDPLIIMIFKRRSAKYGT